MSLRLKPGVFYFRKNCRGDRYSEKKAVSEQKAKELCRKPYARTVDNLARLKLTKDLGQHLRFVEVVCIAGSKV